MKNCLIVVVAICASATFARVVHKEEKLFYPNGKPASQNAPPPRPAPAPAPAPAPVRPAPAPAPAPVRPAPAPAPVQAPAPAPVQAPEPTPPPPPPPIAKNPEPKPEEKPQVSEAVKNPEPVKKPELEQKPEAKPEVKPEAKPESSPERQSPSNPHPKPKPKPTEDKKKSCKVVDVNGYFTSIETYGPYFGEILKLVPYGFQNFQLDVPKIDNLYFSLAEWNDIYIQQCQSYEHYSMEKFFQLIKDNYTLLEALEIIAEMIPEVPKDSPAAQISSRMLESFLPMLFN